MKFGGELPEELNGIFTDENSAMKVVNAYLAKRAKNQEGKEKWKRNKLLSNYRKRSIAKKFAKKLEEQVKNGSSN